MNLKNIINAAQNLAGNVDKASSAAKGLKGMADDLGVANLLGKKGLKGVVDSLGVKDIIGNSKDDLKDDDYDFNDDDEANDDVEEKRPERIKHKAKRFNFEKSQTLPSVEETSSQLRRKNVATANDDNAVAASRAPRVIDSLDGMNAWLSELQEGASESVQSALKAQMMVIKFVQSPTLVDTTIDTLVFNLKKSLASERSEEMREKIHDSFSLMIQNYVFFLDARMQAEINANNKPDSAQLVSSAGEMLSQSVVNVAMLAIPGGGLIKAGKALMGVAVKNVFTQDSPASANFFSNLVKFFLSDQEETQNNFYKTIYTIILKLGKYSSLIGKSILISGMIERYTPYIVDLDFPQEDNGEKSLLGMLKGVKKFVTGGDGKKYVLFHPDAQSLEITDEIESIEKEIERKSKEVDDIESSMFSSFKQKKRKALEDEITELQAKRKKLKRELRANFEKSLLDIAEKYNEFS